MLNENEIKAILPLVDIGIKTAGLKVFSNSTGGDNLQSAINKLQAMMDADRAARKKALATEAALAKITGTETEKDPTP